MKRYILTGGTMAFIDGKRVDVGEIFTRPDDVKPPRFSLELAEGEGPPAELPAVDDKLTMSQLIIEKARASDAEPVS